MKKMLVSVLNEMIFFSLPRHAKDLNKENQFVNSILYFYLNLFFGALWLVVIWNLEQKMLH